MRSKNRTKAESDWHKAVANFANESAWLMQFSCFCNEYRQFHLDHILGAQAKRKVNLVSQKVGEWVVIPVPIELHDVNSNNKLNVTHNKKAFEKKFGSRLSLWFSMVNEMRMKGYNIPFDDGVIKAVLHA